MCYIHACETFVLFRIFFGAVIDRVRVVLCGASGAGFASTAPPNAIITPPLCLLSHGWVRVL
jgi:hypothetical protein